MVNDKEIMARLIKSLTSAKYALDENQLEVALGGVERILANNLQPLAAMFIPLVPKIVRSADTAQVDKLMDEVIELRSKNDSLRTEVERLRMQLLEQVKQKVSAIRVPERAQPSNSTRKSQKPWTPEEYQTGVRMFKNGASWGEVSRKINRSEGEVKGRFINRGPSEELLGEKIEVQTDGPMTFLELWKIGSECCGEGWRAKIEAFLGLPQEYILWNDPSQIFSPTQIASLREWWGRRKHGRRRTGRYSLNPDMRDLREAIRAAGPNGMTVQEMIESDAIRQENISYRRFDLTKARLIFDCGKKRGRGTVWVDCTFSSHYPEAWEASMTELDQALYDDEDDTDDVLEFLRPLSPELSGHLREVDAPPTAPRRAARCVYEGILRAGPEGISIKGLELGGWGEVVHMALQQMSKCPAELERQGLIKQIGEEGKSTLWMATFWEKERPHETEEVRSMTAD